MKPLGTWLQEYGRTHQNLLNQKIHLVCVPAIFWSIVAFFWALPVPGWFPQGLNWAIVFWIPPLIFYFRLGISAGSVMLIFFCLSGAICYFISQQMSLMGVAAGVFTSAWIGQFYGHHVEGVRPAFFEDIQFLLIGPLWTWRKISNRRNF